MCLFRGRWPLRAFADDTVSPKVATHFSSLSIIRADNRFVSTYFFFRAPISLTPSCHPFIFAILPAVSPALQAQPVRQYPLRQHNEPAIFIMGERQGQRVPPSGPVGGMPPNVGVGAGISVGMGVGGRPDAQVMLAQQNREMEALERRSQRERSGSMNPAQVRRITASIGA